MSANGAGSGVVVGGSSARSSSSGGCRQGRRGNDVNLPATPGEAVRGSSSAALLRPMHDVESITPGGMAFGFGGGQPAGDERFGASQGVPRSGVTGGAAAAAMAAAATGHHTPSQNAASGCSACVAAAKENIAWAPNLPRSTNFTCLAPKDKVHQALQPPRDARAPNGVLCPRGHVMEARVVREMFRGLAELRNGARCRRCHQVITTNDARYSCAICSFDLCMACAADPQRLSSQPMGALMTQRGGSSPIGPLGIGPGDVIVCGPDAWGIHHVVLVCSALRPDPRAGQLLEVPEGKDTFGCQIIECTRGQVGAHSAWHPATTYYARDRKTGLATIVGQMEPGTNVIDHTAEPVPVKVLLHPMREGAGLHFDEPAFDQAVLNSAVVSQRWGLSTALKAMVGRQDCLRPADYTTPQERRKLLADLRARWSSLPICSSVIIMVWQYYFLIAAQSASQNPEYAEDIAVRRILRWMPLWADETVPSTLLKVLTKHGWLLRGNLDV